MSKNVQRYDWAKEINGNSTARSNLKDNGLEGLAFREHQKRQEKINKIRLTRPHYNVPAIIFGTLLLVGGVLLLLNWLTVTLNSIRHYDSVHLFFANFGIYNTGEISIILLACGIVLCLVGSSSILFLNKKIGILSIIFGKSI